MRFFKVIASFLGRRLLFSLHKVKYFNNQNGYTDNNREFFIRRNVSHLLYSAIETYPRYIRKDTLLQK